MITIPDDRGVFSITLVVEPGDIDEQHHVNNIVYLRWVQEVAYAHWNDLGSKDLKEKFKWVVLRHEIDYHAPALLGDNITVSTWIDVPEGPRQRRYVSIQRKSDRRILATATTSWCLLDGVTGRPKRVPEEITSVFGLKN